MYILFGAKVLKPSSTVYPYGYESIKPIMSFQANFSILPCDPACSNRKCKEGFQALWHWKINYKSHKEL